jgi:hypothetical protein
MKKNRLFMTRTLAVMLAFGLVLVGCETDAKDDSGGGDGHDSVLVAKWYDSQDKANAGTGTAAYEFKADGSMLINGRDEDLIWKTSGSKVYDGQKVGGYRLKGATYKVSRTVLTISDAGRGSFTDGKYYKKAK